MNKIWLAFTTKMDFEYGDLNEVDTWDELFQIAEGIYKDFSKTQKAEFQNLLKEIAIKNDKKYHYSNFTKKYYEKVIRKMFDEPDIELFSIENKGKVNETRASTSALRFKDLKAGTVFTVEEYRGFIFKKISKEIVVNSTGHTAVVNTVILMAPRHEPHNYLKKINDNTIVQKVDVSVR